MSGIFYKPIKYYSTNYRIIMLAFAQSCIFFISSANSADQKIGQGTQSGTESGALPILRSSLGVEFIPVPNCQVKFAKWETRVSDFDTFLKESGYEWKQASPFPQNGDHPVVNVNLADIKAFCDWLTFRDHKSGALKESMIYRLPTNTEWDTASGVSASSAHNDLLNRSQANIFPWGTQWPPPKGAGNFNSQHIDGSDDGYVYTAPVGSFNPSPSGLFDLAGNVWEWVSDETTIDKVTATLRGGSWKYFRKECLLSSYRYQVPVSLRKSSIGFRCVVEDTSLTKSLVAAGDPSEQNLRRLSGPNTIVDPSEIERVKREMSSSKGRLSEIEMMAAKSRLLPTNGKRAAFSNSLGMAFQPLPNGGVLICEHEVRVKDIDIWMLATGRKRNNPPFEQNVEHPAVNLSWIDARMFCHWLTEREHALKVIDKMASYRLPTDVEWSAAAVMPVEIGENPAEKNLRNKLDFPWGFEWPLFPGAANVDASSFKGYKDDFPNTAPVCSFKPNEIHLYDLAGNVAEWCEDEWPGSLREHVVRGGSWKSSSKNELLSSARQHFNESEVQPDLGFRIVLINQFR